MVLDESVSSQETTAIYKEVTSESPHRIPGNTSDSLEMTSSPSPPPENYVDLNKYTEHLKFVLADNGNNFVPERTALPERQITFEFLLAAVPAGLVFLAAGITLFSILCIKRRNEPEEQWQAFTESLFLVIKVNTTSTSYFNLALLFLFSPLFRIASLVVA